MEFLTYFTKGLKGVVEHEILDTVPDAEIQTRSEKYLIFDASRESLSDVLELKTADDLHTLIEFREYGERPDTEAVIESFSTAEMDEVIGLLESVRDVGETVSVTASRFKNDRIDKERIKTALGSELAEYLDKEFTKRDHSNLDLRVHVEQANVLSSVRVTRNPLYHREYKKHGRAGALKPSIAAGLIRLTDPDPGDTLVDTFCGVGTILCEGTLQTLEPYGGDIDEEAVRYTRDHLRSLGPKLVRNVTTLDAKDTKLPEGYYDLAVSNVPWGDQLDLNAVDLYSQAIPEYARILDGDGTIVLLGPKPDLVEKHLKENFPDHTVSRFRLGFLGQHPWVNVAYPEWKSLNTV